MRTGTRTCRWTLDVLYPSPGGVSCIVSTWTSDEERRRSAAWLKLTQGTRIETRDIPHVAHEDDEVVSRAGGRPYTIVDEAREARLEGGERP